MGGGTSGVSEPTTLNTVSPQPPVLLTHVAAGRTLVTLPLKPEARLRTLSLALASQFLTLWGPDLLFLYEDG